MEPVKKTTPSPADLTNFQKILPTKLGELANLNKVLAKIATYSEKLADEPRLPESAASASRTVAMLEIGLT